MNEIKEKKIHLYSLYAHFLVNYLSVLKAEAGKPSLL